MLEEGDPFGLPPVGSNQPADPAEAIRADLAEKYVALTARRDELLNAIGRVPASIDDDEMAGKVGDFAVKQLAAWIKNADAARVAEKEPFLSGGRTVDGWFHALATPLDAGKKLIDGRRKAYLDRKAVAEKAARAEAERLAREAAAAAQADARDRAAAMRDEVDLARAVQAEEAAALARAAADKAAREAAAKPADMSRVRGEYGSVSSLKEFWNHADLDRATLDLEALRQHIPSDALDKAVRSWIAAHKDDLKAGATLVGVRIFLDTRL